MVVKFDDNACVLINKGGEPIGTRLTGKLLSVLSVKGGGVEGKEGMEVGGWVWETRDHGITFADALRRCCRVRTEG